MAKDGGYPRNNGLSNFPVELRLKFLLWDPVGPPQGVPGDGQGWGMIVTRGGLNEGSVKFLNKQSGSPANPHLV